MRWTTATTITTTLESQHSPNVQDPKMSEPIFVQKNVLKF